MEATQEQIEGWKKQYGDVFKIDVDGHIGYLHKPDRKQLSYATSVAQTDPLKFNELLLKACWIAGDEAIQKDDTLFLSAGKVLSDLIETKTADIVKL